MLELNSILSPNIFIIPSLYITPPFPVAVFAVNMEFCIVIVPVFVLYIAPPLVAVFDVNVTLSNSKTPSLYIAPPSVALFSANMEFSTYIFIIWSLPS